MSNFLFKRIVVIALPITLICGCAKDQVKPDEGITPSASQGANTQASGQKASADQSAADKAAADRPVSTWRMRTSFLRPSNASPERRD